MGASRMIDGPLGLQLEARQLACARPLDPEVEPLVGESRAAGASSSASRSQPLGSAIGLHLDPQRDLVANPSRVIRIWNSSTSGNSRTIASIARGYTLVPRTIFMSSTRPRIPPS